MERAATHREESGADAAAVSERPGGVLPWLVLAGVFWCGLYRIRFGIDLGDEGLYLASPMRYALGDLPFRDEWMNALHMFDLVLAPLFLLFPNVSVHQIRLLWLAVQFGSTIAVYALFKRFSPPIVVALACGSTVWVSNLIWTPGYHLMGACFSTLGLALWLSGSLSESRRGASLLGFAGGLAFFLGALSFVPLVAVLVVPVLVLGADVLIRPRRRARMRATVVFLGTVVASSTTTLLSFAYFDLFWPWVDGCRALLTYPFYVADLTGKVPLFFSGIAPYAPIALAVATIVLGLSGYFRYHRRPGRLGERGEWILAILLAAATGGLVCGLLFHLRIRSLPILVPAPCQTLPLRIVAVGSGLHLGALTLLARRRSGENGDWLLVYSIFLAASLMLAWIYGVPSNQAFKITYAALPIMVSGVVVVHRGLRNLASGPIQRAASTLQMVALSLAVGAGSFRYQVQCNYAGPPLALLTHEFSHPLLSGLRADEKQAVAIESVLLHLAGRVRRGDFLLAYDNLALLYYLTQTRPAIDHALTTTAVPVALRRRAVRKMIEGNRVPPYAIRYMWFAPWVGYSTDEAVDPVHAFVVRHYTLDTALPGFEIWRLREDAPRPPGSARQ